MAYTLSIVSPTPTSWSFSASLLFNLRSCPATSNADGTLTYYGHNLKLLGWYTTKQTIPSPYLLRDQTEPHLKWQTILAIESKRPLRGTPRLSPKLVQVVVHTQSCNDRDNHTGPAAHQRGANSIFGPVIYSELLTINSE